MLTEPPTEADVSDPPCRVRRPHGRLHALARTANTFTETTSPKRDYALTLVDEKTGKKRTLPVIGSTSFTVWSPDGKTVATVLHGNGVVEITLATRDGTLYIARGTYSQVWASSNDSPERLLFRTPGGLETSSLDAY